MVSLKDCSMKKNFLFLALLALVTGCDSPQRTRTPGTWMTGGSTQNPVNQSGSFNPATTAGTASGVTSGSTSGSGSGTPSPGFEACDLSDRFHTIDIGFFGLCQSTQDETLFKFKTSLTSTTVRTCLIPTYKESNGSSTYIGQPQCTYTTAGQVVQGKLLKNRQGFEQYPLNGVIVMKEPLLPQYIGCMNGYVNWPQNNCPNGPSSTSYCAYWSPRCPYGGRSNGTCDTEARNYMGQICTSFKNQYSNSYIDIRTR